MNQDRILNVAVASILLFVGSLLLSIPVTAWKTAGISQKAINRECGTDYSQWDMLFAGENLTELCRIKQQELLIKQ